MYVTTFYSFKGGVGRSMALVNTAVCLVERGCRVLVVDFDIEAPGLDTFEILDQQDDRPGLVDFVAEYIKSGESPDSANYMTNCGDVGVGGGNLWIMPSGRRENYSKTLGQIDWPELYNHHDGYLLFEDLKEQWRESLQPDYVLIDSRTGHTDTGGICTRQLADAVVMLFFPNDQNLRGLAKVVEDIRAETKGPREKVIDLHYVMSNVPYLDDEDQILGNKVTEFQEQLQFYHEPIVIHRYDSMSLLNQSVFTKDRPNSRLANEYRALVKEISVRNLQDRVGALEYIHRARTYQIDTVSKREDQIASIEETFSDDGEILFRLAELKEFDFQSKSSEDLLSRAIDQGYERPEVYFLRLHKRLRAKDRDGAALDARRLLDFDSIEPRMIVRALQSLIERDDSEPQNLADTNAVRLLDTRERIHLAQSFNRSHRQLLFSVTLLEQDDASNGIPEEDQKVQLVLCYIGLGRFQDAVAALQTDRHKISKMREIANAFNLGMALWGLQGDISPNVFERVIEIDQASLSERSDANYCQCLAMAHWATGNTKQAIERLNKAREIAEHHRRRRSFSCWHYLAVDYKTFVSDLDEMQEMFVGESDARPRPRFLAEGNAGTPVRESPRD